jgi:septal ring factor EnvC (AmiA/AmiB activator)
MSSPQYPYPPQPPYGAPQPPPYGAPPPSGNSNLLLALAAGAIVASLAANAYLLFQVHDIRTDSAHNQEIVQKEIDTIQENSTQMTAAQRKHLDDLKQDLDTRSRQLSQAANQEASQAKREALSYADEQKKQLEAEQQKTAQQLSSSISDVNQKAESVNTRVDGVNNDVAGVKTDLNSTKSDLSQTKSNLQKVTGDLSGTNSLVATNGKEIEELRRRGERNIVEFTLKKQKNMQKVGDISLLLEKADIKNNKFSFKLLADDKTVEKKDRNINEPLQFYVSRSLYEIVVNTVGKDQISGYLSTPKYQSR